MAINDDYLRQMAMMKQAQVMQNQYGSLGQFPVQAPSPKPKEEPKPDERLLLLEEE